MIAHFHFPPARRFEIHTDESNIQRAVVSCKSFRTRASNILYSPELKKFSAAHLAP
jgi:hypothetical protein